MTEISKLTGSPWHAEKMTRKEGDPRRHRAKCDHYEKSTGKCKKRIMRCMGSAHCDYYHSSEESITDVSHKREHIQRAQPFNGVKKILMEDIEIEDNKFAPPSQEKVQAAIDYYNKNESFDSPIVVSCEGGKYYLQDKYVRYYAALQLGVKEIHARIGTYNDHSIEDKIHRKGQRVQHEIFGKGTIINSTIDVVEIRFKSGKTKRLGIRKCIDEKLISFI